MVARCRTSHATFELIPVDLESIRIGSLYHAGKLQTIQINSRPHIYLCRIQGMIYRIPTLIQRNLIQITNVRILLYELYSTVLYCTTSIDAPKPEFRFGSMIEIGHDSLQKIPVGSRSKDSNA